MEVERLPEEVEQRINRIVREHPTFAMIRDLPPEIQLHVVLQMPHSDVLQFCATSRAAKTFCDDDTFWKLKVARDFPKKPAAPAGKSRETYEAYLKEKYIELFLCARRGHTECVESLLQFGVPPNIRDETCTWTLGGVPLVDASGKGHIDIVRLLLDHGADPNIFDTGEKTALMTAVDYGYTDIVLLLLENGANINLQNSWGYTALMASMNARADLYFFRRGCGCGSSGRVDMVRLLLDHGADPDLKDVKGTTARGHAIILDREDKAEIIRVLSE